jgi:subtilisin family serine protease
MAKNLFYKGEYNMKHKIISLFVVLFLVSCGSEKLSNLTSEFPKEPAAAKVTVQSILSTMEKGNYREGELIVKFKSGVVTASSENVHRVMGATVVKRFSVVNRLEHVKLPAGLSVKDAVVQYMSDPSVEYAEPNYIKRIKATVPNDPYFGQQWALRNTGTFASGTAGADIKAPEAWDITRGNGNIIIAVLDTGIDLNHPDLVNNIWINAAENPVNGVDDDGNGFIDDWRGWNFVNNTNNPLDDDGHGTHVSGIIGAAGNNGIGTAGVMWNVKIMPLKFIGAHPDGYYGKVSDEIAAIQYAIKMGAKIMNASFGGADFSNAERDAIAAANAASIIFVAAAGNSSTNNDLVPEFPASYSNPAYGGLPNIISVAATDQNDVKAPFSGYGLNSVHVGAPGNYIISTVPNYLFPNGYDFMSGTSMAAPHVSGLAGLLSTYYTNFTYTQIRATILRYVDVLPTLSGWIQTGGRINAYRAVSSLLTPTGLAATSTSSSAISLTWTDNATGEDGYKVERKTGNGSYAQIATPAANTTSFADSGLIDGTLYTYRVRAFNTIPADSFYSNEAQAITPLNAPTGLTATAISGSQVTLTWADNSQTEGGYKIERKGVDSGYAQIATVGPNVTTFTDSGLASSAKYWYRVRAFNSVAGDSAYSAEAEVMTLAVPGQPVNNGGGGGCSIGARQNTPTAVADFAVMLVPLLLMVILRKKK